MPIDRRNLICSVRFSVYGALFGLIVGIPLGIGMATRGWALPFLPTGSDAAALRFAGAAEPPGDPLDAFNLDGLLMPASSILHGGPPKDGIPALTNPSHVHVDKVDFLATDDRIVGVTIGEEARAYPIRLLNYHEIVNDELGGVPIAVIYCPLCDSVSVVVRRIGGDTFTFGVSGLLLNSNVLMYDRTHDALWTQVGGRALSGPLAGRSLPHINSWEIAPFNAWAERHPQGRVVSFETGHQRDYRRSPYARYFENDDLYFPVPPDDRLPRRKTAIVGVRVGDSSIAVPVEAIKQAPAGRFEVPIGENRVTLASDPVTHEIAVIDAPEDAQIIHTFWFAWAAFHPETQLLGVKAKDEPSS